MHRILVAPGLLLVLVSAGCAGDDGSDPSVETAARAVYSIDGERLVVYTASAGDPDVLTPANLAAMDAGEVLGFPWTRIEVPAGLGGFDLAAGDTSSFRVELPMMHPYTESHTDVVADFTSGEHGLSGSITVDDLGETLAAEYDVRFAGDYVLFDDVGTAYLELDLSRGNILADDPGL